MNGDDELQKPLDPPQITEETVETEGTPVKLIASVEVVLDAQNKSQVTKLEVDGHIFYVRENAGPTGEAGPDGKPIGVKWLDLCAPESQWLRISGIVFCEDSLKRPVRRAADFTAEWAEKVLADGAGAKA